MRQENFSTECETGDCCRCPLATGEWDAPDACACDCGHEKKADTGACKFCEGKGRVILESLPGGPITCPTCMGKTAIICAWDQKILTRGVLPASHTICPECRVKYFPNVPTTENLPIP